MQLTSEKGCAQKRKDVSYIAPNGEEIKSSRHLIRYLKAHPGGLKAENFVWETGAPLIRDSFVYYEIK